MCVLPIWTWNALLRSAPRSLTLSTLSSSNCFARAPFNFSGLFDLLFTPSHCQESCSQRHLNPIDFEEIEEGGTHTELGGVTTSYAVEIASAEQSQPNREEGQDKQKCCTTDPTELKRRRMRCE
jgi:hypothetical protein